ncbi:MAG: diadenylate cyclase CdaA [Nitrospirota bacterium]|nr:diadenylate cyclase CdaA [Nitrospirota bacterium]
MAGNAIHLKDILDITLLLYLVYRLFLAVKGTQAVQMLIGAGILGTLAAIVYWLDLRFAKATFNTLWPYGILLVLFLFQQEIRRLLAQIGTNPLWLPLPFSGGSVVVEELVRAATSLANKRIGGLLVIERDTDLKSIADMGVRIEARISRELLLSIYHPTSPIHDGAVMIRRGKIAAAGCFLPLTQDPALSPTLGTRHRAAIGLTEESDAVVIVISEETGKLSVVIGGKITSDVDQASLRDMLTRLFAKKF